MAASTRGTTGDGGSERGASTRGEGIEIDDARSEEEEDRRTLGVSDSDSDPDAELCGVVLPDDDDTPIVSKRVTD